LPAWHGHHHDPSQYTTAQTVTLSARPNDSFGQGVEVRQFPARHGSIQHSYRRATHHDPSLQKGYPFNF